MSYENRERMGGLCAEEKTCSRDPSWLQIARSMYHTDFNVVKPPACEPAIAPPVDKPGPVPYSVPNYAERPTPMTLRTLLDRYIFTELLSPFCLSLSVLVFIMVTRESLRLVELLVSKGVGLWAVLKVFAHLLPSFLVLTLPIAG